MSIITDKKFINLISSELRNFKWKKESLANCSCPICGDSKKNKSKARGYFFIKDNNFFFKCHNCGIGTNIYNFLDKVSPSLCKEYSIEVFKEGGSHNSTKSKKTAEEAMLNFKTKTECDLEEYKALQERIEELKQELKDPWDEEDDDGDIVVRR